MASDPTFAQFVVDQIGNVGDVSHRGMFGGFVIYLNSKVVALVCDNQLYVKPTQAGRNYIGEPDMAPPYEGAKDHFLIGDQLEDSEWLGQLIRVTAAELPEPKEKKPKQPKAKKK